MECAYLFCHEEVVQPLTGRRKKYHSEACKHADYRRKHPEKLMKNEIRTLKSRIAMLEYFAKKYAPPGYRFERDIQPIPLVQMVQEHAWVVGDLQQYIGQVTQARYLKPDEDGNLGAHEQEAFYRLCHDLPGWKDCPRCPHGVIP